METPVLEVRNLKKYFKTPAGQLHAVDDVSFTIEKGHTLGVVGESGCGKTTLGRTILRLLEPTSGQILFHGEDITKLNKEKMKRIRKEMQLIFQDPYASLNPRMSVSEIIKEPMIVNKMYASKGELEQRVKELMEVVGLAPRLVNTYPHEMDGGRRQRVGIARALATNPQFIVCDEPVSALDVSIQAQIINLLEQMQKEYNLTYLFISHALSVVRHISDRVMVMYLGRMVEFGETDELFANPLHPYTKALLSAVPQPDPDVKIDRVVLEGEVPNPAAPPSGCHFHPRCQYCTERCTREAPPLVEVNGRMVACWNIDACACPDDSVK